MEKYFIQEQKPIVDSDIKCFIHGKKSTMVCTFQDCINKTLCQECIPTHTQSHLGMIQPIRQFDSSSNTVIKKLTHELHQYKQRTNILQQELQGQDEIFKRELGQAIGSALSYIGKEITLFQHEIMKVMNTNYNKNYTSLNEIIRTCEDHLNRLEPYQVSQQLNSQQFDVLLQFQDKLLKQILPEISKNLDALGNHIIKSQQKVNSNFHDIVSTSVKKVLKFENILQIKDQKMDNNSFPLDILDEFKKRIQQVYSRKENQLLNGQFVGFSTEGNQIQQVPNHQSLILKPMSKQPFEFGARVIPYDIYTKLNKKIEDVVLEGHEDIITCFTMVDVIKIISGDGMGFLKSWNINHQQCLETVKAHEGEIWCLIKVVDKSQMKVKNIASGGTDKLIKLWNIEKLICEQTFQKHVDVVKCMINLSESNQIASAGSDYQIIVWDLQNEKMNYYIEQAHNKTIKSLEYIPNKEIILSGGGDGILKTWNVTKGQSILHLNHQAEINQITLIQQQDSQQNTFTTLVATAGSDKKIIIWDIDIGGKLRTLLAHHAKVTSLSYSSSLKLLISGGADQTVRIWDPFQGRMLKSIKNHNDLVSHVEIDPERYLCISAGWDKLIRIISIELVLNS